MRLVDLDHLERLHAEATSGEWLGRMHPQYGWAIDAAPSEARPTPAIGIAFNNNGKTGMGDGEYIAATHNALPALIAEVRALRSVARLASEMTDPGDGADPAAREKYWEIQYAIPEGIRE